MLPVELVPAGDAADAAVDQCAMDGDVRTGCRHDKCVGAEVPDETAEVRDLIVACDAVEHH